MSLLCVSVAFFEDASSNHVVFIIVFTKFLPNLIPVLSTSMKNCFIRSTTQRHHCSLCHASISSFVAAKKLCPSFLNNHDPQLRPFCLWEYSPTLPSQVVIVNTYKLLVSCITKHKSINALVINFVSHEYLSDSFIFFSKHRESTQHVAVA